MIYQPPPRKMNRATLIAVVVIAAMLVAGAVVAIVVTTSGVDRKAAASSANAPDARAAAARDDALADGTAAVESLMTLDYRTVEEDLDRWESMATGELLTELKGGRDQTTTQIRQAKSKSTATALDAALAEFDERAGTARMIAAFSVEVTIEGQAPPEKRNRMVASLERTDDGWKISSLNVA